MDEIESGRELRDLTDNISFPDIKCLLSPLIMMVMMMVVITMLIMMVIMNTD